MWLFTWVGVVIHLGGGGYSPGWEWLFTWVGVVIHLGGSGYSPGWEWLFTWVGVVIYLGGLGYANNGPLDVTMRSFLKQPV